MAWLIDLVVLAIAYSVLVLIAGAVFELSSKPADAPADAVDWFVILMLLALPLLYLAPFEARSGRTPGKRAMGLRVARVDGAPRVGWGNALGRALWRYVSALPLGLGFAAAALGDRRAWHDRLSHTVVVPFDAPIVIEDTQAPAPIGGVRAPQPARLEPVDVAFRSRGAPGSPDPEPVGMPPPIGDDRLTLLAEALYSRGHREESAWLRQLVLRDEVPSSLAWVEVARLLFDAGRHEEALRLVNGVLLAHPANARATAVKAFAVLQAGRRANAEALALARRAYQLGPSDPLTRVALAFALLNSDELDEADTLLAIDDLGEEELRACMCRMALARRRGDWASAEAWTRRATELSPHDQDLTLRIASVLAQEPVSRLRIQTVREAIEDVSRRVFWTPLHLRERAVLLARVLATEPQNEAARARVLRLPTGASVSGRRRTLRVLVIASVAAVLVFGLGGSGSREGVFVIEPLRVGVYGFILGLLALHLRAQRLQRAQLTPGVLEWMRYLREVRRAAPAQRAAARASAATARPPKVPTPPAGTVLALPSACFCEELNFLYGGPAVAYASVHLARSEAYGAALYELACPTTLTSWLLFEASGDGNPVRLCRVDPLPRPSADPSPGQYL